MSALRIAAAALLLATALPGAAQDALRGRQLYETHCGECHYERMHGRDRSRSLVRSLTDLRLEVARWAAQVKRGFTPAEIDDIAAHLDRTFYRFGERGAGSGAPKPEVSRDANTRR